MTSTRLPFITTLVCLTALCACGDDGGDGGPNTSGDGGAAGSGGGPGGGGPVDCSGEVSGAVTAGFTRCVSSIVYFPDGTEDRSEPHFIYTLVGAEAARTQLDEPLETLGINLFLDGMPETGTYGLGDSLSDTQAHVYAPFSTAAFTELTALELVVDELEEVTSDTDLGYLTVGYYLDGSFEMTLEDDEGESVTVSAEF